MGQSRRRIRPGLAVSLGLLAAAVVTLVVVLVSNSLASTNGFAGRGLYVQADSPAARASAASPQFAADFETLVSTPTAIWIEPDEHPVGSVGGFVSQIAEDAASVSAVAVFVVYGIPDRDCGNESRGGLDEESYPGWVRAIAEGLDGTRSVVILEPDSLALSEDCGDAPGRVATVRTAVDQFDGTDSLVYLDGGHSNWRGVDDMAALLDGAGVGDTSGFATNVSNYNSTADEHAYGYELSERLGGAHFVVDISRNGAGSNGEWCNPSDRRVGAAPTIDTGEDAHDGDLWIKTPGESDGLCNDGPPAGDWWDAGALELLGR